MKLNLTPRNTISKILVEEGISYKYIVEKIKSKCCNGCGPKGMGMDKWIKYIPNFLPEKYIDFLTDAYIVCCIHDVRYNEGGCVYKFLKANYNLGKEMYELLNWTRKDIRFIIGVMFFLATTILGWLFFNWKCFSK